MEQGGSHKARFILLTGAPRSKDLSWADADLTVELQPCFEQKNNATSDAFQLPSSAPTWRELHQKPKSFHSGFSQQYYPVFYQGLHHDRIDENGSENSTASIIMDVVPQSTINDLYMARSHSLSVVESFLSTTSGGPSQVLDPLLSSAQITDLGDLPTATHLEHLPRYGQPLVNLLGVVLADPQIQSLKTKWSKVNKQTELIRLLIADDTRTNFELSLWLDQKDAKTLMGNDLATRDHSLLRETVENLQGHDIVLFQNMALRVFQNRVSASSVRGLTSVRLLYRDRPPALPVQASLYSTKAFVNSRISGNVSDKVLKVLDWRDNFLETPIVHDMGPSSGRLITVEMGVVAKKANLQLPIDTQ